jgi:hypothetical protein
MRLAVIVPSRGRPEAMRELLATFEETCTADTRIICRVDDDDPMLPGYREAVPYHLYCGPRIGLGASINEMALARIDQDDVIGFMGDDHRPRTHGWDARVLEEITAEPLAVVYGDDLLQGRNLASQVFMSSQLVRRLGWFNPPGIRHMYIDNFWMTLGANLGTLTFLDDVIIEHMHPIAKKSQWDAGYAEVNAPERYAADKAAFEAYLRDDLVDDLRRVVLS